MLRHRFTLLTLISVWVLSGSFAFAATTNTNNSAVGGVLIDAEGRLAQASVDDLAEVQRDALDSLAPISKSLNQTATRKISLKKLNDEIVKSLATGEKIPDAVRFLGGLTAIEYVLIYPEEKDVVLVGPAEGWTVGPQGVIVGKESKKPVILLDDLVTAIQSATGSTRSVFSVSIDPTKEGLAKMTSYASSVNPSTAPKVVAAGMEDALGLQTVTLQGVDPASHFAYVMAAADFRMKQISMGVTKSPVRTLPSFVSMMKTPAANGALPRWWLAPNYDAITRDEAGLTWVIKGAKVVTMTDTDFFDGNKVVRKGADAVDVFGKWADKMTENYEALSVAEPIFGQLRNCMDCALVAAIIAENDVLSKVDHSFGEMLTSKDVCTRYDFVPAHVPSTSVVARRGGAFMFVTGGVSINPWETVKASTSANLDSVREKGLVTSSKWYQN